MAAERSTRIYWTVVGHVKLEVHADLARHKPNETIFGLRCEEFAWNTVLLRRIAKCHEHRPAANADVANMPIFGAFRQNDTVDTVR
jgi:hypothetical protein